VHSGHKNATATWFLADNFFVNDDMPLSWWGKKRQKLVTILLITGSQNLGEGPGTSVSMVYMRNGSIYLVQGPTPTDKILYILSKLTQIFAPFLPLSSPPSFVASVSEPGKFFGVTDARRWVLAHFEHPHSEKCGGQLTVAPCWPPWTTPMIICIFRKKKSKHNRINY
jgi:hypothetical protein